MSETDETSDLGTSLRDDLGSLSRNDDLAHDNNCQLLNHESQSVSISIVDKESTSNSNDDGAIDEHIASTLILESEAHSISIDFVEKVLKNHDLVTRLLQIDMQDDINHKSSPDMNAHNFLDDIPLLSQSNSPNSKIIYEEEEVISKSTSDLHNLKSNEAWEDEKLLSRSLEFEYSALKSKNAYS